jgi:hypothetical protein
MSRADKSRTYDRSIDFFHNRLDWLLKNENKDKIKSEFLKTGLKLLSFDFTQMSY